MCTLVHRQWPLNLQSSPSMGSQNLSLNIVVEIRNNFFSSQVGGFFRTNMRMISFATESFCILFLISNVNRYITVFS